MSLRERNIKSFLIDGQWFNLERIAVGVTKYVRLFLISIAVLATVL